MLERRRLDVQGSVQGVGFRPFVYRLAEEMALAGWVVNSAQGAVIEVEAETAMLDDFGARLQRELPRHAVIHSLVLSTLPVEGCKGFTIRQSSVNGVKRAHILPDLAVCPECLRELHDPADRRFRYPFINCTHCGPRFSIVQGLPYDRPLTTMADFPLCPSCRAEYENPHNRRFHAQPVACPVCGPQLMLRNRSGAPLAREEKALEGAATALRAGAIVALKGIGGFQLLADARNDEAVHRLRQRKGRDAKPLAVMFPSLALLKQHCVVHEEERELLASAAAPIVLLRKLAQPTADALSVLVAPDNPNLGAFLPYSPLHHLLLEDLGFPLVATSANLSGEPICIDLAQVLQRLPGVADLILDHNRPITRPLDDSVVAIALGEPMMLRRARGYAPQPVAHLQGAPTIIATGSQQKNCVALLHGGDLYLSQHLGDMESAAAADLMQETLQELQTLYDAEPTAVSCDQHPDYAASRLAERLARNCHLPLVPIQHHRAHLLACMLEHGLKPPVLGIVWDGTGLGDDDTIWGGEFLRIDRLAGDPARTIRRVAHLRPFALPGGDAAAREPRRALLGLLHSLYGPEAPRASHAFAPEELRLLQSALRVGVNVPRTSSMGRLFDAVAALLLLRQRSAFEGEAAMALEFAAQRAARDANTDACYPFALTGDTGADAASCRMLDLKPMLDGMLAELPPAGAPIPEAQCALMALRFHNTLAAAAVAVAQDVSHHARVRTVALSGGCFQNRLLLERTVKALQAEGFEVYWQRAIPPNDGGLAAGEAYGAVLASQA